MWGVSYWIFPLISGFCWLGMLMGMLIHWQVNNNGKHLPPMAATQTIAYISDIGSQELKPLFIAGSCVTTIFLDLSFLSERLLRHKGRLARNTSMFQKVLSWVSIGFAAIGTAGLILLSIFDNWRHNTLHNIFLVLFIGGYVLSAIFICWEYQRLGIHFRQHAILRISFWIKLFFILIEIALAIGFGVCSRTGRYNAAAVLEWIIAFVFTFYVFSFFIDLIPAVRTKDPAARFSKDGKRMGGFGTGPSETVMQIEQNDGAANSQTTVGQNDERAVNGVKYKSDQALPHGTNF